MQQTRKYQSRWKVTAWLAGLASLFFVVIWFGYVHLVMPQSSQSAESGSHASARLYNSVESLSEISDVVIIGQVVGVVSRQADTGVDGLAEPIPSTWYRIEVQETLKGDATGTITVVRTDPGHFLDVNLTTFRSNESVLLFLMKRTSVEFPMVTLTDTFYVPVSFDNGVFDVVPNTSGTVQEATLRPRISNLFDSNTFTKSEIQQAVSTR